MTEQNDFTRWMRDWKGNDDARRAIFTVTDALSICQAWWRAYGDGVTPTATDLLKMVEIINRQEEAFLRDDPLDREAWKRTDQWKE